MLKASYILYHTQGCHLCDIAMALLVEQKVEFTCQDICDNESLVARYSVRIPVLRHSNGNELNWPFDKTQLDSFTGA